MATSEVDIPTREMSSRYAGIHVALYGDDVIGVYYDFRTQQNLSLYNYDQFYSAVHIEVDPWLNQKNDCHRGYSKPAQELNLDSWIFHTFPLYSQCFISFLTGWTLFCLNRMSLWMLHFKASHVWEWCCHHRVKWKNSRWFLSGSLGNTQKKHFPYNDLSRNLRWCCEWFPSVLGRILVSLSTSHVTILFWKMWNYQAELTLLVPVMLETTTRV